MKRSDIKTWFKAFFRALRLNTDDISGSLSPAFAQDLSDWEKDVARTFLARQSADPLKIRKVERLLFLRWFNSFK